MLLDDDLYPSSTTAAPFSPSQQHAAFFASPKPAESDGYRITWGPSAGSILADISKLRNNAVSSVKRTSANAGLASPTRPGAAGASLVNNNIQPLRNWVPQQPQLASASIKQETASNSKMATATASRFSKRRRRYPSGSILATDCDRVGSSSSTMEIDDSTLNPSTLSMFDELQKRLEAKRAAAQAEREAELAMEKENSIKRQQNRKQAENSRDKGKGRAQVCSPILELSEKSHATQSQQQARGTSSNTTRPVLQPKQDINASRPSSQQSNDRASAQGKPLSQTLNQQPLCSTPKKALNPHTYRLPSQPVPSSPAAGPVIGNGAGNPLGQVKRQGLERKTSSSTSVVPDSQEAPILLVSDSSKSPVGKKGNDKIKDENDDMADYWNDEEDKSLEMEMSQMTFPAAVPASQTAFSQATKGTAANIPVKSISNAKQDAGGSDAKTWTGFQSRDKRLKNIVANSDEVKETQEEEPKKSSGGLSTKPLARVVVPAKPAKTAALPQKTVSAQPLPTKTMSTSATINTTSSKPSANVQAKSPAVKKTVSAPVMQPASNKDSSVTATSGRVLGNTTAPRGLTKTPSDHACSTKWKPPTIVNKQKSLAAKEKFVKTVGVVQVNQQAAPYVGDDLDGVDFDDDSF